MEFQQFHHFLLLPVKTGKHLKQSRRLLISLRLFPFSTNADVQPR